MANIDLSKIISNSSNELDPVTQQPTYKGKKILPINLTRYNLASQGETAIGQYFPEDVSQYDKDIPLSRVDDIGQYRAESQPTGAKWGNAAAKMGITALTTIADGTIGTIIGLTNIDGEDKNGNPLSDFVNNSFIQSMLDLGDWSEKVFPNYYTQQEQEDPWYENLGTANFWADKVLKNFGFAIGAYVTGMLAAGASSYLTGSRALQAELSSKISKGLTAKAFSGLGNPATEKAVMQELLAGGRGLTDDLVKGLVEDAKKLKKLSLTNQIVGSVAGSGGEARIEAGHAMREFRETEIAKLDSALNNGQITPEQYELELADIDKKALSVGNHVFGLNMAVLSASNFAQFRHSFGGGYELQKKALGATTMDLAKGEVSAVLPVTKLGKIARRVGAVGIGLKNAMIEGNEEMLQRVASESSKDHYSKMIDGSEGGADEFVNSIWEGFGNTYGNIDAWEEFVIGAFSGGIGIPTIQNKRLQMAGGVWGDLSEQMSKGKRTKDVVESLKKVINSPAFKNRYYSANVDMASEKAKDKAVAEDDIFNWKTEDDLQFANMVNTFYNAGQLDQLYEWLEGTKNATASELRELTSVNKGKTVDGKVVEKAEVTEMFKNWTDEDIVKYNKDRAEKLKTKVEKIREIREAIDVKFAGVLSDDDKTMLSTHLIALEGIDKREQDIHEKIKQITNLLDGREITDIARKASSLSNKRGWINTFNNKHRAAKAQVTRLNNLVESLESKIVEHQAKSDMAGAARSRRAASTEDAKVSKWRDKITQYKKEISDRTEELDYLLKEEHEARKKVVETSPELYQDMTFEEYRNEVMTLSDKIDEFEDRVKKSYERIGENPINPSRVDDLQTYIKDLYKLNQLRMNSLKNYVNDVQKLQKNPKAYADMRKEVEDEIADRNVKAQLDRILSNANYNKEGVIVSDIEGNKLRIKKISGKLVVAAQDRAGKFSLRVDIPIDKEFAKTYMLDKDYKEAIKNMAADVKAEEVIGKKEASNSLSPISIHQGFLWANGEIYTYTRTHIDEPTQTTIEKTDKYIRLSDGIFYRIYGEGESARLGTKKYAESYFSKGNLKSTEQSDTIRFEGEIKKKGSEFFLTKHETIPELESKIEEQKLQELSEAEQVEANEEADETIDDDIPLDSVTDQTITEVSDNPIVLELVKYGVPVIRKTKDGKEVKDFPVTDTIKYNAKDAAKLSLEYEREHGVPLSEAIMEGRKEGGKAPKVKVGTVEGYTARFPQRIPKKIILIAKDRKDSKTGQYKWGKPIVITNPKELANYKISKPNENGNRTATKSGNNKLYFVKEVDWLGDNAKYSHWKYSYSQVAKNADGKFEYWFGKDRAKAQELTNLDEFLKTAVKDVDYSINPDGSYKIFRWIEDGIITDSHTRPIKTDMANNIYNFWGDNPLGQFDVTEKMDYVYLGIDKYGNKIGVPRTQWMHKLSKISDRLDIGKGYKAGFYDRNAFESFNSETGTYDKPDNHYEVVTEPTDAVSKEPWDPNPRIPYQKGVLFANTFPSTSNVIGDGNFIDNQPDDVKRFTVYSNKNDLRKGHAVQFVLGSVLGVPTEFSDRLYGVITKEDPNDPGDYKPVDIDGNFIDLSEVSSKGVYTSIAYPDRFTVEENEGKFEIVRKGDRFEQVPLTIAQNNKKELDEEVTNYKTFYESTVKELQAGGEFLAEITKVTNGQAITTREGTLQPSRSLKEVIGDDTDNFRFHIGTKSKIVLNNGNRFEGRMGYVYLEDVTTGKLFELETNRLNEEQASGIISILQHFVSKFEFNDKGILLPTKDSTKLFDYNIFLDGIKKLVYFQDRNNINKKTRERITEIESRLKTLRPHYKINEASEDIEAGKFFVEIESEEKKLLQKELEILKSGKDKSTQINSNPATQFYLANSNEVPGGLVVFGRNIMPLVAVVDGKPTLNPELVTPLTEFLLQRKVNINKSSIGRQAKILKSIENGEPVAETVTYDEYILDNTSVKTVPVEVEGSQISHVNKKIIFSPPEVEAAEEPKLSTGTAIKPEALAKLKGGSFRGLVGSAEELGASEDDTVSATDGSAPESGVPISSFIPKSNAPRPPFRIKIGRVGNPENFGKFRQWVKEKFGEQFERDFVRLIPTVVEGRWGEVSEGLIKLYQDAEEGTGYHEALHKVLQAFLTEKEIDRLLNAIKTDSRFAERVAEARRLYLNESERYILEEALAEEFRDFILDNGKSLIQRKQGKVYNYFRRILNWIKGVMGINDIGAITTLFNDIENGRFKNRNTINRTVADKLRKKFGFDFNKKDSMQGITHYFFKNLFNTSIVKDGLYELFGKEGINKEIVDKIYDETKKNITALRDHYIKYPDQTTPHAIAALTEMLNRWEEAKADHREFLKKYGVEVVMDEDTLATNQEGIVGRSESGSQYNYSSLRISAKANSTRLIKALVGGLTAVDNNEEITPNSLGLPSQADFGKVFSVLSNKLVNIRSLEEMKNILNSMEAEVPEVKSLIERLKINEFLDNPENASFRDVELIFKFMQTFSRNKNLFIYGLINEDGSYKADDANFETQSRRILESWRSKFYRDNVGSSKIRLGANNIYYYNSAYFKDKYSTDYSKADQKFDEFLADIGITGLKREQLIGTELASIKRGFFEDILKGNQPVIFTKNIETDFGGRLNAYVEAAAALSLDYIENAHFNISGDLVYNNTVNTYISLVINSVSGVIQKYNRDRRTDKGLSLSNMIVEELPHLNKTIPYLKNSVILDGMYKGRNVNLYIHEGNRTAGDDAVKFDDFSNADRLYTWFKMAQENKWPMLRTADNALERFLDLGDITLPIDINSFINYLSDEMNFSADKNNFKYTNFAENRFKGIVFDSIFTDKNSIIYLEAVEAIENNTVEQFIKDNQSEIANLLKDFFVAKTSELVARLSEYGFTDQNLDVVNKEEEAKAFVRRSMASAIEQTKIFTGNLAFTKDLDDRFKRNAGQVGTKKISVVDNKNSAIESWIRTNLRRMDRVGLSDKEIENVYYYKNGKPILRTQIVADVVAHSQFLEDYRKILGDNAEAYTGMDETDGASIASIDEIRHFLWRAGDWSEAMENLYQWEAQNYYAYRIRKSPGNKALKGEFIKLFGITYERFVELGSPINPNTKELITSKPKVYFNSLKPQYYGPMAEEGFISTMYKTSFMPLLPSMFIDYSTDTITHPNLSKQFEFMRIKGVGVVSYYSANKGVATKLTDKLEIVGGKVNTSIIPTKKTFQPLYNSKGEFNNQSDYITQDTFYEYWGVQVDTGNVTKNTVVFGTQLAKHIMNGLYNNGTLDPSLSPELKELVSTYLAKNRERLSIGLKILTEKLGIERVGDTNEFTYDGNVKTLVDSLTREAVARNNPDNVLDSIELINEGLPIDALVNSGTMETILFALADKMTISQKMFGKASYQLASTGFETEINGETKTLRTAIDYKGTNRIVSNDLKSYQPTFGEDGKLTHVKAMEVYLPSFFKGKVNIGTVDSRLLNLIGFRIPTQGLNSVDSIIVKGFLSDSLGDVIVVPSEIVAKSGSDFDIDKLNIYIPNFYMNEYNNPVYFGRKLGKNVEGELVYTDNITYEEYLDSQKKRINQRILNVVNKSIKKNSETSPKLEAVNRIVNGVINSLFEFEGELSLNRIAEGIIQERNKIMENTPSSSLLVPLTMVSLDFEEASLDNVENITLLSQDEFDKKIIENEIIETFHKIILHPDNARQLLNPIDSKDFKDLAEEITELKGTNKDTKSFSLYGDVLHHLQMAKQNMEGAGGVGIAANAGVFQIYAAKHGFKIAPQMTYFNALGESNTIDTNINLAHNEDGGLVSLGGRKDANGDEGKFIYEVLNAYISLTVDNSKDPLLDKLNAGLKTLNTVLYLAMAGVPINTLHYFMNQPIILEYIENLSVYESQVFQINNDRIYSDDILQLTKEAFLKSKGIKEKLSSSNKSSYSEEELKNMIGKNSSSKQFVQDQLQLLDDFIRYQRTATSVGTAIQGIQYDTKSFGKNSTEAYYLLASTEKALEEGVIINYDNAFKGEDSFIGAYKDTLKETLQRYNPFIITTRNLTVKEAFTNFIGRYVTTEVKIGRDRIITIADAWKKDFLTYLLLTRQYKLRAGDTLKPAMTSKINDMFKGKNSVPSEVQYFKDIIVRGDNKQPLNTNEQAYYNLLKDNQLLRQLNPIINPDYLTHSIAFHSRKLDALESDGITEGWRELFNATDSRLSKLGSNLVEFVILQSGVQNSPINFMEFIPYEIYGNIMDNILQQTGDITSSEMNNYTMQFYINNYTNNDIVKKVSTKQLKSQYDFKFDTNLYPVVKVYELKDEYANKGDAVINRAKSYGIKVFKNKPSLYLSRNKKKIDNLDAIRAFNDKISLMLYGTPEINKYSEGIEFRESTSTKMTTSDRLSAAKEWQDKNCK